VQGGNGKWAVRISSNEGFKNGFGGGELFVGKIIYGSLIEFFFGRKRRRFSCGTPCRIDDILLYRI